MCQNLILFYPSNIYCIMRVCMKSRKSIELFWCQGEHNGCSFRGRTKSWLWWNGDICSEYSTFDYSFFPLIFRFCRLLITIISTTYVLVDITVRGVSTIHPNMKQYLLAYVTLYNRLNHFFYVDINVLHAQASWFCSKFIDP